MTGLGDTVAEVVARARATPQAPPPGVAGLAPVRAFGPNPGGLAMGIHVPADLPPKAPLVVVLHGCGQTAAGYAAGAGWIELAGRYGFAVLCPEQVRANNPNLCFNWFEEGDIGRDGGEAASIAQMVRHAVEQHRLDGGRVFVTGLSAGGAMAAVMLATHPELFAGGAVIAGLPYGAAFGVGQALQAMRRVPPLSGEAWGDKVRGAAPAPAHWPRIAIWCGDADSTVAPGAADALALQWCDVHGVHTSSAVPTGAARHACRIWRGADGRAAVELHTVAGLGHGTPIAAAGPDGCGAPGPWIVEAGISSSDEIARSWGLDAPGRARPKSPPSRPAPAGRATRPNAAPSRATDVGETIARALRTAGLLR